MDEKINELSGVRNSAQITHSNHTWNFGDRAYIPVEADGKWNRRETLPDCPVEQELNEIGSHPLRDPVFDDVEGDTTLSEATDVRCQ